MADAKKGNGMRVDTALVRELAEMLSDNELTEIEVEDGDRKIRVRREGAPVYAAHAAASPVAMPAQPPAPAQAPDAKHASADEAPPTAASVPVEGDAVKSPMVGTAYLSAEPGAKPFISEGDSIKEGDTLLIVEAMKVMNPIPAPRSGVVKKILVADAQPVEFEQELVVIG